MIQNLVTRHNGVAVKIQDAQTDAVVEQIVQIPDLTKLDGLLLNFDFSDTSSTTIINGHFHSITDIKGGIVCTAPLEVARPKVSTHNGLNCALFDGYLVNGTYHQRLVNSGTLPESFNTGYGDFFCVAAPIQGTWQLFIQNSISTALIGVGGYPSISVKPVHTAGQFNGSSFLNSTQNGPQVNPPILASNNFSAEPLIKAFSVGAIGTKTSTSKYRCCVDNACHDMTWWAGSLNDQTRWFNQSVGQLTQMHIGNSTALNNGAVGKIMQLMYVADPLMTDAKRIAICRALAGKWGLT
jgi:hypothetical protein